MKNAVFFLILIALSGCSTRSGQPQMGSAVAMNQDRGHFLADIPPFRVRTLDSSTTLDTFVSSMVVAADDRQGVPENFEYLLEWRPDRGLLRVEQTESAVPFVMWFAVRTHKLGSDDTSVELQPLIGWAGGGVAQIQVARARLNSGMRAHLKAIALVAEP